MATQTPAARWDRRFAARQVPGEPAAILRDNLHLLPPAGRAVDLACGLGGNAVALAHAGLGVDAFDISAVALDKLARFAAERTLAITTHRCDLEDTGLRAADLDVVVCAHYLYRPLCADIIAALRPGGLVFYQTFTAVRVDDVGPANPDFLLAPNELLRLFAGLDIVVYREEADIGDTARGLRNVAGLVARRTC